MRTRIAQSRRFFGVVLAISLACMSNAHGQQVGDDALRAAVASLESALAGAVSREEKLRTLWSLADLYREQGNYQDALQSVHQADALVQSSFEKSITALRWGGIAISLGRYTEASAMLSIARGGRSLFDRGTIAALELELGHLAAETDDLDEAVGHFDTAVAEAGRAGLPLLETRSRVNAIRARMDNQDLSGLEDRLAELHQLVNDLQPGDQSAFLLLACGDLHRRAVNEFGSPKSLLGDAYDDYVRAERNANSMHIRGYAYGFLGALFEDEARYDEALRLTSKAVFAAQSASADEQLYRWEWQQGRIFKAQGRLDDARDAYRRAVAILDGIRTSFVLTSRMTFETLVAPVYAEYADILLVQSISSPAQSRSLLGEARNQLETLKQGEIENYFGNQCVVLTDPDDGPGRSRDTGVAVIYPVLLDDRIEVLIEAGGSMLQFTTWVGEGEATQTIRQLRLNLERSTSGTAYLEPAQRLFEWLIAPSIDYFEANDIQTLMMVPGGALRTVPLAALHDGRQFLIEHYAVVNTPAIGLLNQSEQDESASLLIGGLTESVQGYSELPSVTREIDAISSLYESRTIEDAAFTLDVVENELVSRNFTIAHFATHGEFSEDFTRSFILTYDDRLTLNNLKGLLDLRGDDPLDLLVLSACETAAGDDRAALGLAGVAVQSGARSAVASLWYISDTATAELISNFYRHLQTPGFTKVESLRQAQLSLLTTDEFRHPSYWAPFLLIGNWR